MRRKDGRSALQRSRSLVSVLRGGFNGDVREGSHDRGAVRALGGQVVGGGLKSLNALDGVGHGEGITEDGASVRSNNGKRHRS
jgi:hypothetical protein